MAEKIFGLLGRSLGHSWSVPIHTALGCDPYRLIELEPEELAPFLARSDIGGLNVTTPYKVAAMASCDVMDEAAQDIGSVNTLVRREDGKLYAWNTDAVGLQCIAERAGISLSGKKVVILGSGGASLTAQAVARRQGAREIVVVSRAGENNYQNLALHADADILINTTPVGMYPQNGEAPVDLDAFPACQGVLDLIYNPVRTALLLQAQKRNIPCCGGLPMLVAQAKAAEEHFTMTSIPDSETDRILSMLSREMVNIVLIGMPGSGKSTVGQALAERTGREAIDLDRRIAEAAGCSIPEIFAREGEAGFRRLERETAAACGKLSGKILITGGGIVKDPRNYAALRQNGRIYHLMRDLDALPTEGRPLSQGADLHAMWAERAPLYAAFRDATAENNGTVQDCAEMIWRDFCAHSGD